MSYLRTIGYVKLVLAALDVIVLISVAALVMGIRTGFFDYSLQTGEVIFFVATSFAAVLVFRELHLYKHRIFTSGSDQVVRLAQAMGLILVLQAVTIFLIKDIEMLPYSRSHTILYVVIGWMGLAFVRVGIFRRLYKARGGRAVKRRVLIVGAGSAGQNLATRIKETPDLGLTLAGFMDDDPEKIGKYIYKRRIHGPVTTIADVAERLQVRDIYVAINRIEYYRLLEIIEECRKTGLPVTVTTTHFKIVSNKVETSEFDKIRSMTLRPNLTRSVSWLCKQAFDVVGAAILLFLLSPMLGAIAGCVKLNSKGPVFYKSVVVGRNGKLFTWYKFRTMVVDRKEDLHREHLAKIIKENKTTEKLQNDPRITRVGRTLRKYSLDELPQLFNVLKGQMSLIGPRPCLQYEYEHFDDWHKQRFRIKPGITGLWQVTGRNKSDVTFNDSIILDLYYIQNFSLWLDMKIFLKTIPVVLFGRGGA